VATPRLAAVRLEGADGRPLEIEVLSGARRLEPRPAIVICHASQEPSGDAAFRRLRERLAVAGFTVLSFGARGRAAHDLANLATVVDYAVTVRANWVGLVGQGAGVEAVGGFGAQDGRVNAVALWPDGGEVPVGIPAPTTIPSLIIRDGDSQERTLAFFASALP
jgi:hypothetical protein